MTHDAVVDNIRDNRIDSIQTLIQSYQTPSIRDVRKYDDGGAIGSITATNDGQRNVVP
jgi:hypothetical protein